MSHPDNTGRSTDKDIISSNNGYNFTIKLDEYNLQLKPVKVDTLQVNITKMCNRACKHCHVDASPNRTEQMNISTVERCLELLWKNDELQILDITGGAPELNPHFRYMVKETREIGKEVMVRHNLSITLDGNPVTGERMEYLPDFFAETGVTVISSLPFYQEYFTDKQRGRGVFKKSIESIKLLNDKGYGKDGSGLELNFVYNPVGAYLPPAQKNLEADYRRELLNKHGIVFNNLFTITNMPINRFGNMLKTIGGYEDYMEKLVNAFNPCAAEGIMCRSMISVGYDGSLFDCDFNQMLDMRIKNGKYMTVFDFDIGWLKSREIMFGSHCFGCTAGAGSSCGGAIV
jgi:radical SAM/Cys-rich protein